MKCAVWYMTWRGVDYDLEDSEERAARMVVAIEDGDDTGTALGVQFADGRLIPADQWQALADARKQAREREDRYHNNPPPPIPMRKAVDPFAGYPVQIEESEPDWLGAEGPS